MITLPDHRARATLARCALALCFSTALLRAPRVMASHPAPPLLGPFSVEPDRPPFTTARSATVRLSAPDVIHIPAGEFWMGSNQDDIDRAQALCERDAGVSAVLQWSCARAFPPVEAARAIGSPCERAGIHQLTLAERGRHRVLLGAFAIDRTEVTVLAYDRCVEAGACARSPFARASAAFRGDDQPMVAVSWYEARAYCQWVRGRLPTEAEWERVARGREGRVFPWGNLFNPRLANVGQASPSCRSAVDGFEFTAPVGSFVDGASPDGALDMAGNVAEWVDDFFDDGPTRSPGGPSEWERSPSRYPENTQRVSPRLTSASQNLHVFRGGSFVQGPMFARATHRSRLAASERREWLGFRCAYDGG